ncbi:MAG: bifunctional 5,10-methylenetetrahydrofolate dehydrogenase/5,10-methenyltetrahydrofolate cyclohydrolase [Candidatus Saccharibacteria bacterium]
MNIIDGKKIAQIVADELTQQIAFSKLSNRPPKLVIIGSNPDARSLVYIKAKIKRAEDIGIDTDFIDIGSKTRDEQISLVEEVNRDNSSDGIIIQLPLDDWSDPQELIDYISKEKDVDGLTTSNQNSLLVDESLFTPATPLAVMKIIESNNIKIAGKTVCVVGRSKLVGKPLKYLLESAGANVLVVHSKTKNTNELILKSDIVVSAAGKPGLISVGMVKENVILIDVGITEVDGKIVGDIDMNNMAEKASLISPVPGGVGPVTVVMLLSNVIKAYNRSVAHN